MNSPDNGSSPSPSARVLRPESDLELSAFVTPAALAAPDHVESASLAEHLPFLFWLCDSARPGKIVEAGAPDPTLFFGLCQAIAQLPLDATCHLIGVRPPTTGGDGAERLRHWAGRLNRLYATFAHMAGGAPRKLAGRFDRNSIDLLVLHADPERTTQLREWYSELRPRLSARAIVLVHGTGDRPHPLEEEFRDLPTFRFDHAGGLDVVLFGSSPPALAKYLLGQPDGKAKAVRVLFERFGLASRHASDARRLARQDEEIDALERSTGELREELGRMAARLAGRDAAIGDLRDRLKWHREQAVETGKRSAGLEAQALGLRQEQEALPAAWEQLQNAQAIGAKRQRALKEQVAELQRGIERAERMYRKEKAAARSLRKESDERMAADMKRRRSVKKQIVEAHRDLEQVRRRYDREKAATSSLRRELEEVHASRSWRLMAPLRRLAERVRGAR